MFLLAGGVASGASPSPGWQVDSIAEPTDFSVGHAATYKIELRNSGSIPSSDSEPIVIEDEVPQGLTVTSPPPGCTVTGQLVRCEFPLSVLQPETCVTVESSCDSSSRLLISLAVSVNPGASGPVTNTVTASGGGASQASKESFTNTISTEPPPFGPSNFNFFIDGVNGAHDTQAGDHPYQVTTTIDLKSTVQTHQELEPVVTSVHDLKDVIVDLPLGFVGSTLAAPRCTLSELTTDQRCPHDTQIGHIHTEPEGEEEVNSPIWNMVPEHGVPAEFGYVEGHKNSLVFYAHVVPSPQGYVLQVRSRELPQAIINHIVVTFFGDPALRDETGNAQVPFFTDPSACQGAPLTATIWMDSWQHPARLSADGTPDQSDPNWAKATSTSPAVTGCNTLSFTPELFAQPTTHQADSPSGLEFELKLPQTENAGVPATPALKNLTVTFPEGMTVDPSAADGLGVCSEAQIGWEGPTLFDFNSAQPGGAGGCPENSKVGSLEIETPLIPTVLHGEVFLAAQNANPFGAVFATYIVVNDPVTGVVLKLAGELKANPATGQLTAVFDEFPQLPFSDAKTHFFGGPRAELTTPPGCGLYTTNSELQPWSFPGSGPAGTPFDTFVINEDCAIGFAPGFAALTTNVQAGEYTPFLGSFSRDDNDQELSGLTMSLPPGLLANVASVTQCGEAEIQAEENDAPGGCPASSLLGTVLAEAGPGPNPLAVPGKVFFTGPHNGGPYGLAVVVSANPGPFHFGNVVVRESLRIDAHDAHVTDVSDPFPAFIHPRGANGVLNGIPIKLRRVNFNIDRSGFTFNPTSCDKLGVSGRITSAQGAVANLAVPFQVTACERLKFTPKFSVSTSGMTSKANGASLTAKVTEPSEPQGAQANITRVKVDLPIQLPSRLTTLQKACLDKVFEVNPAACPSASRIGFAVVHTPILPQPLTGPAIFVSHGGEAFPSLTMILQGNGVTIDLVGTTFISKAGITSTTFKTVPDTPFSTFELTLPQGRFSALGANLPANARGSFCGQNLKMPTEFVAQNGAVIHQQTPITVTGCKKTKTRAQLYAAAVKACHRKHNKEKRQACVRHARKEFSPSKKAKK